MALCLLSILVSQRRRRPPYEGKYQMCGRMRPRFLLNDRHDIPQVEHRVGMITCHRHESQAYSIGLHLKLPRVGLLGNVVVDKVKCGCRCVCDPVTLMRGMSC